MSIFAIIELILKALNLLDGFNSYMDQKRAADQQAALEKLGQAVDDSKKANDDGAIWNSQDGITNNLPKP